MNLRPITAGKVSGTSTTTLEGHSGSSGVFGGALITTDGSNAVTVTIRETDGSGTILFQVITVSGGPYLLPVLSNDSTIHYVISGTNGEAMLYEWHP